MTAYIIDTETTDSDPKTAEVIELAYAPLLKDFEYGPAEIFRFKPSHPSKWGALATHHILPLDLEGHPASSFAALPSNASYLVGHNVDFDWEVLGSPPVRRICTLAMARAVWPELDSHKLGALVYFIAGANASTKATLQSAHSASADISFCYYILKTIISLHPNLRSIEDLWGFSEQCRIPTVMSFGKFKGEPISNVDRGWVSWYRRQPDTDPYLLEAFKRAGK